MLSEARANGAGFFDDLGSALRRSTGIDLLHFVHTAPRAICSCEQTKNPM